MSTKPAGLTVFAASAAVLVLEILAGRLMAPYFGTSLETFTAIIGVVLAGISLGTWLGGRLADRLDPGRLIGPELALGGMLTLAIVPLLSVLGPPLTLADGPGLVLLVTLTMLGPAAVLSAVPPAVVKLVLRDLGHTGRVVGRLSALGTAGALLGTFATGFLLVGALPSSGILVGLGAALTAWGAAAWWRAGQRRDLPVVLGVAMAGALLTSVLPSPCDAETSYACARVEADPERPSGRFLVLDTVDNSYLDLEDPTHLEFTYTRMFAAVIETHTDGPVRAVHIGGGGFSMPRWIRATRPGSHNLVLEIDPDLVELARDELGLVPGADLEVVVGDARRTLRSLPDGTAEVVLGDAFSGLTVPWHLTTVEAVREVRRILAPEGIYAVNIIDHEGLAFLRAEIATLEQVFEEVAAVSLPQRFTTGGNFVLVASSRPLDLGAIRSVAARMGLELRTVSGAELARLVGGASVLTDDHAPVDQLRA